MTVKWFPDRSWGGRVYVPATGRAAEPIDRRGRRGGARRVLRLGLVSPRRRGRASRRTCSAKVDFTDVTAEENPDWQIDLNDDVIGGWRTDGGRGGDVTLIWGLPLVRGAVAATAELDGETARPGAGRRRPLHPGRGRRGARLRRRPLPRGQALGPRRARARLREPLRRGRRRAGAGARAGVAGAPTAGAVAAVVAGVTAVAAIGCWRRRRLRRRRARTSSVDTRREAPPSAKPKPIRFTVSASGDLLMHQPLLDRARANGDGREYDFAPFFERDPPVRRAASTWRSVTSRPRWARGRPRPIRSSTRRPGSRPRSTAAAGTPAAPPPTTRSTRARRGSTAPSRRSKKRGVEHTGSFRSRRASSSGRRSSPSRGVQDRLRLLHRRDQRDPRPAPVVAERVRGGGPAGRGARRSSPTPAGPRRAGADAVIVNVHWGSEYAQRPERVAARGRRSGSPTRMRSTSSSARDRTWCSRSAG